MIKTVISALVFSFLSFSAFAQTDLLKQQIEQVLAGKKATVGVAVYGFEKGDTLSVNNQIHYPLQSIFKFHIALAVLNRVDKGELALDQKILITKKDLLPDTWSPIRDDYPNGNVQLTIAKIIEYTIAQSDNNGCDILLRLIGGAETVNDYIKSIGVKDFSIRVNEEEMHREWNIQFLNWTTPESTIEVLRKFHKGKILSEESYDFLWKTMAGTTTGVKRIKGKLPAGTTVAHKTGTSGTNEEGITAAINDVGIVTLPTGEDFAISVFVSNSKESQETNERIIAEVSKLVWDWFVNQEPS
ncbi:class A beta-lactamase, subclass A2 [Albibacterium sp.]|uniref:class A beta-lactamase, subclass A2 n=1 Tax=Albibacterium sp. TaxID=2952885 RepID=UPI002C9D412C|nr:class A beta-lactamase, subclass A2 [Albibacterium sp.]HUH18186.1 class A beta-lactamase, subclass A2 [Albibacterium sp.]